jgi:hypothetical protein
MDSSPWWLRSALLPSTPSRPAAGAAVPAERSGLLSPTCASTGRSLSDRPAPALQCCAPCSLCQVTPLQGVRYRSCNSGASADGRAGRGAGRASCVCLRALCRDAAAQRRHGRPAVRPSWRQARGSQEPPIAAATSGAKDRSSRRAAAKQLEGPVDLPTSMAGAICASRSPSRLTNRGSGCGVYGVRTVPAPDRDGPGALGSAAARRHTAAPQR